MNHTVWIVVEDMGLQIFQPVETVVDFRTLDEGEILCGYMDGLGGTRCSLSDVSRSYWHGWRNGLVDAGFVEPDPSHRELADAFERLGDLSA